MRVITKQEREYREKIGLRIRMARERKNYTQEFLAEKADRSSNFIGYIERGIAFGKATTLVNICNSLEVDISFLFQDVLTNSNYKNQTLLNDEIYSEYQQLNIYNQELISLSIRDMLKKQTREKKNKF